MLQKKSFRLLTLPASIAVALLSTSLLLTGCDGDDGDDGVDGQAGVDGTDGADGITNYVPIGLKRLATAPLDAEFTGLYLNSDNTLFLNVQHPSSSNTTTDAAGKVFDKGTVGVIVGQDFSALPENFGALDLPVTTAQKEVVMTAVGSYQVLAQQGDSLDDGLAMGDIMTADGATQIKSSNDPDFNGVVSDGNGGFYVYTNWEDRPGSMSRIQVSGLTDSGYGNITQEGMIDFSGVGGTWVNCFGTVSPWNTPMSAEELYFDDTSDWFNPDYEYFSNPQSLATYLGYPTDGSGDWPNPYRYGYIVEIGNAADAAVANVTVNKLETMGRFSHENSVVMPDDRTVFLSDDGTGVVFFKFVADVAGDMSAGTLYAAQITQAAGVDDPAEAALGIEWIELASMGEADIEAAIASFDGTFADGNYITDEQVCDWAESKSGTDLSCDEDATVDANPFSDDRVAYLESRKAAVALGATGEFRKMEGVNINYNLASTWWNGGAADGDQAYMYMAMSSFDKTMSDDEGAIQLNGDNGKCGVVYRMKLMRNAAGEVDVMTMVPAIVGGPYYADRSVNECNVNNISNPDNLLIMDDGRVLIGEDTGNHENNVVWVFDDPAI
ncbi:MAG: alkaline phosphatase PhoX [Candidatus Thiodiazotropha taylori]